MRRAGGTPDRKPALVDTNSERRSTPDPASICRACPTLSSPRPFLQAPTNPPRLQPQVGCGCTPVTLYLIHHARVSKTVQSHTVAGCRSLEGRSCLCAEQPQKTNHVACFDDVF